jgi:glycerate kinase
MQNKALVLIDKFKGSLSQVEINEICARVFQSRGLQFKTFQMADGGDGSLDALAALGWQTHDLRVTGPLVMSIRLNMRLVRMEKSQLLNSQSSVELSI